MTEELYGLTFEEASARKKFEEGKKSSESITKSKGKIFRDNIFTVFNFLNFAIAAALFAVGAYSNLLFIGIIILNIAIGIFQELKAKKLVDELSILNRPKVRVRREGQEILTDIGDVVKGDLLVLKAGDQICSDAVIISGSIEVNESLLTGESDAVVKEKQDRLFSGSFVISGKAYAEVSCAGSESYAAKLVSEVKKEKKVYSELLSSMKKVTNLTGFMIIPLGIIFFLEAYFIRGDAIDAAVISSSAALLGMLPKGLVLLISVSLAAGVIRLSKMNILVQNIYSLETLAHVDTLCLDKTGTITDGNIKVCSVIPMAKFSGAYTDRLIRSYLAASDDNNATFNALAEHFSCELGYEPVYKIPFSSKRKWGSVSFRDAGTVFVGAPERLLGEMPDRLKEELNRGRRIIVIGYTGADWRNEETLPAKIQPLYGVILEDNLRPKTRETLAYFKNEGVDIKVISGDHVVTVAQTARRAGLDKWENAIDLSEAGEDVDYDRICQEYSVFARVTPKQKQELVKALKRQGHCVAMTGDGVNDLLALREADCSIAMGDGSDAGRQAAQIVLLSSEFTDLPQVVMEGRRVIHNVTRIAQVFFIKTIYSVLVTLLCLITGQAFPFIPIQITLIDACIEAYPSFLTIFEKNMERLRGSFLKTALTNAAPFGIAVTGMIAFILFLTPLSGAEAQTVMYILLIIISMAAVIKSCIPFTPLRIFICVTMIIGIFGALMILPGLFEVVSLTADMGLYVGEGAVISLILVFICSCLRYHRRAAQ